MEAFIFKNRPIYKCKVCDNLSEVSLRSNVYWILWVVQILSVAIFAVALVLGERFYLLGLIVLVAVYGVFYWFSPGMIKLKSPRFITRRIPWYKKLVHIRPKNKVNHNKHERKSDDESNGGNNDDLEIFSN